MEGGYGALGGVLPQIQPWVLPLLGSRVESAQTGAGRILEDQNF